MGYAWSYSACSAGQLDPVWQPLTGSSFQRCQVLRARPPACLLVCRRQRGCRRRAQVVYETLPGWQSDISGARCWEDLPANAQRYVRRIEELIGVQCKWIGVGPGRDAMVVQEARVLA
jgi:Adenylosuccinate synthetase